MKKALSKAKIQIIDNEDAHKEASKAISYFDEVFLRKQVLEASERYADLGKAIAKDLEMQKPFLENMTRDLSNAARAYGSLFDNGTLINQAAIFQSQLETTLKNAAQTYAAFAPIEMTHIPNHIENNYRYIAPPLKQKSAEITDDVIEKIAFKVLEKMEEKISSKSILKEESIIKLPADATWYNLRLEFCDEENLEIYYKDDFIEKADYKKLGFSRKDTKDRIPDQQWRLLSALSTFQLNDEYAQKATIEELMISLHIGKRNLFESAKSELSKKLRKAFIDVEPFEKYKNYTFYKPKFNLKPLPMLRGNGEAYLMASGYIDGYNGNAKKTKRDSDDSDC